MATVSLQCHSHSQMHSSVLKLVRMADRAYMGEVLAQVRLKYIKK